MKNKNKDKEVVKTHLSKRKQTRGLGADLLCKVYDVARRCPSGPEWIRKCVPLYHRYDPTVK
jgi:hypothetical protein